jgi:hypothetical protein
MESSEQNFGRGCVEEKALFQVNPSIARNTMKFNLV